MGWPRRWENIVRGGCFVVVFFFGMVIVAWYVCAREGGRFSHTGVMNRVGAWCWVRRMGWVCNS